MACKTAIMLLIDRLMQRYLRVKVVMMPLKLPSHIASMLQEGPASLQQVPL